MGSAFSSASPAWERAYLTAGYMFPRHDGIILGGTFDHGDWSLVPKPEQRDLILETRRKFACI